MPLPILLAGSPFAAHLHRQQCSSNFPAVPTQPLSHIAFGDCGPYSTLAMTLLYSQDMAVLFARDMSRDTTSVHALWHTDMWH